jgi:hypothetical protein
MISDPLDDALRTRCRECGATVWRYPTAKGQHRGEHVLLEDVPGGYSIHRGEALRATLEAGYRAHRHDRNRSLVDPVPSVDDREFLWV